MERGNTQVSTSLYMTNRRHALVWLLYVLATLALHVYICDMEFILEYNPNSKICMRLKTSCLTKIQSMTLPIYPIVYTTKVYQTYA